MGKNILIVLGSPRKKGNSTLLAKALAEGAEAAGHHVDLFDVCKEKVDGCTACNQCWSREEPCVSQDGFNQFARLMMNTDVIVMATPVYWGTYPSQLKALIDKMYAFVVPSCETNIAGKKLILLACGDGEDERAFEVIMMLGKGLAKFLKWEMGECIGVPQLVEAGEVLKTDAIQRAKTIGRSI